MCAYLTSKGHELSFFYCYNIRTAICKHSIHFLHFSGCLCVTIRQKRSAPLFVSTRCLRCYLVTLPSHGGRLIFKECFFFFTVRLQNVFVLHKNRGETDTRYNIFLAYLFYYVCVICSRHQKGDNVLVLHKTQITRDWSICPQFDLISVEIQCMI